MKLAERGTFLGGEVWVREIPQAHRHGPSDGDPVHGLS